MGMVLSFHHQPGSSICITQFAGMVPKLHAVWRYGCAVRCARGLKSTLLRIRSGVYVAWTSVHARQSPVVRVARITRTEDLPCAEPLVCGLFVPSSSLRPRCGLKTRSLPN